MSIRKIPIQTRSFAGKFLSIKNNKLVNYESQLEYACMLMLEFDDEVISYEPQPLKIQNYIPDVLAKRKHKKDLLIEVKYSEEALNPTERLQKKFQTLQEYVKQHNMIFQIFTENNIKEPYFSNIKNIYKFANQKISKNLEEQIINSIPDKGISIQGLFNRLNVSPYEIPIYKGCIMHLIYTKKIITDLNCKITNTSILFKGKEND
jgi:hypothetical protein